MDFKKLKIESLLHLKGQITLGVTINLNQEDSVKNIINEIKSMYINKEIKVKTSEKEITTKILDIDGYKSNYDFKKMNVFFQTDLDRNTDIETDNEIIF